MHRSAQNVQLTTENFDSACRVNLVTYEILEFGALSHVVRGVSQPYYNIARRTTLVRFRALCSDNTNNNGKQR